VGGRQWDADRCDHVGGAFGRQLGPADCSQRLQVDAVRMGNRLFSQVQQVPLLFPAS